MEEECPLCHYGQARSLFHCTDRLYGTTNKSFLVVECVKCKFLRLFPRPTGEELAGYYPTGYWFQPHDAASQAAEVYRRLVLADHVQFVETALRRSKLTGPVLDVGPSGGLLARLLRDRGRKVVGLDKSAEAAGIAWRVNGVPVVAGDLLAAPFAEGSFAAVTMFHVLEHVEQPGEFLDAARRLLKPGGRLVVQVPNAASWQFLILGEAWNGLDVPRHLWNFRDTDLEWLLRDRGFTVRRRKHFSLRDNPAGLATSIAPSLDPMSRRVRKVPESTAVAVLKNLAYLALTLACLPFAALEAACRAGSTIMIEAEPK
ncbi:MAG: class I SAM-dependent methyltransferase [Acidobacteria bacterium]|nr:class I SAM-dependent methyltransferase [Acidobacteriota bacterium]